MKFIIEIFLTGLVILIAATIIPGVQVNGYFTALIAGVLLGIVNATVGLLLRILTFPLNLLTLGLISFIISVLMVLLVSNIMNGFHVNGFFPAMLFAITVSLLKMVMHMFEKSK